MTVDTPTITRAPLWRRALAEFLGTGLLVTVVVGSGIAAQRLSTDTGLQLLENSIATALGLGVLILLFAPVSEADFNPVVSLADFVLGRTSRTGLTGAALGVYIAAQVAGGVSGAILANTMFATPTAISTTDRATPATLLAEIVATAGLVLLIIGLTRIRRTIPVIAAAVGSYIGAAYWFTSSTSFANPAVAVGRVFTDTFAGIAPASVLPFIGAQLIGAALGTGLAVVLFAKAEPARHH
ncbi:Glycerol uptake facilitator (Major Intrinsic Protein Family) [Microbacterium sp. cf046]|uniref:aquaporin n=1 Tax=Microbacterium sp. cf046 TaxID=1761803 RepID=UPI0008E6C822|nr:aquaporin [Microbacterium sp. cf046]SFS16179.1 Glycerol uptake facilitator (Major Intrinsic Protein Family) [Microbacterium sp. cf046]